MRASQKPISGRGHYIKPEFFNRNTQNTPTSGKHTLEAAARLLAAGVEAHFCIVGAPLFGETDYEASLHQQAASLGLTSSLGMTAAIEFLGFQADVPAVLRDLDISVHASIIPEPFGQVIIEGIAAGLPVVAAEDGGVQEIIASGQTGLLVPRADPEAPAGAVAGLIADPTAARRLAAASQAHVRQQFTIVQTAGRL